MANFKQLLRSVIFAVLCISNLAAINRTDPVEIAVNYINSVQDKLKLPITSDIILVIGVSGSGKSTLVHYVAGDYSKLVSLEPDDNNLNYMIQDGLDKDGPIKSSTESRTEVPEMVIDESKYIWYDCPGFSDTRNTTIEISTSFVIKSVIEHAKNIKIILVVSHSGVTEGGDRYELNKLMMHATDLIQNLDRYKNSISMVVTKVQSYVVVGKKIIDITEQSVKQSVANFLVSYRSTLTEKVSTKKEKQSSQAKSQLVDALLMKSPAGKFTKFAIFWRPDDKGPFNKIDKMVKGRREIRETVINQTTYGQINPSDFGYPLSSDAQLTINELAKYTINDVHQILSEIDQMLMEQLKVRIISIEDFYDRKKYLENIQRIIKSVWEPSDVTSLIELSHQVSYLANSLNLSIRGDKLSYIDRNEKNLKMFNSIGKIDITIPMDDYITKFNSMFTYFETILYVYNMLYDINEELLQMLQKKIESIDDFYERKEIIENILSTITSARDSNLMDSVNDLSARVSNLTSSLNLTINDEKFNRKLSEISKFISKFEIKIPIRDWTTSALHYVETIFNAHGILSKIDSTLLEQVQLKINRTHDINERRRLLENIHRSIVSTWNSSEIDSLSKLNDRFTTLTASLNFTIKMRNIWYERIQSMQKLIEKFQNHIPVSHFVAKFSQTFDYVKDELQWYTFLVNAYETFSAYDVHKDVYIEKLQLISDVQQIHKTDGLSIHEDNFNEFVKHLSIDLDIKATLSRINELNEIIAFTLQSHTNTRCNGDTMIIEGNFVKSTDIQRSKCPSNISNIRVFATIAFYVDSDLDLDKLQKLEIFADKWKIMRPTTFNLSGINGKALEAPRSVGTAGKPGNFGSNGGNVFGLANEVIDGNWLTFNINGGHGSNGQDGTSGTDINANFGIRLRNELAKKHWENVLNLIDLRDYYDKLLKSEGYDYSFYDSDNQHWFDSRSHTFRYIVHAKQCCGPNGLGGAGGVGGRSGQYRFIKTNNKPNTSPNFTAANGLYGSRGKHAVPCKTTDQLIQVDSKWNHILSLLRYSVESKFSVQYHTDSKRCSSQYIYNPFESPKPKPVEPLQPMSSIIEYKKHLRQNMKKLFLLESMCKSYEAIDSNPEVNKHYTVADFASELNALEKEFYVEFNVLSKDVYMLSFYDNFLNRIEYFEDTHPGNITAADRQIIAALYSTVLSKTTSFRNSQKSDLIINIDEFFDIIAQNIHKLDETGRISVINKQRDQYNDIIMAKIKETNNFVEKDIQPQIEKLFQTFDNEMKSKINEIQTNKKKIQMNMENAKIILKNVIIRKVTDQLDIVTKIVSVFGQIGQTTVNIINAGTTVTNADVGRDRKTEKVISPAVQILQEKLIRSNKEKLNAIDMELNKLNKSLSGHDQLGKSKNYNFINKLNNLAMKIKSIKSKKPLVGNNIANFLHDFIEFSRQSRNILGGKHESQYLAESFRKTSNALEVIKASTSMYYEFVTDDKQLDEITKAINEDRNTLSALTAFEQEIYSVSIPTVNTLHENIYAVESNLDQKSIVRLDMQQWKVSETLQSIQKNLDQSMSGLRSESELITCLMKIREAISLTINIYDRIQTYQEHSKFVIYLSELHSVQFQKLKINDAHLKNISNQLDFNLQANIIMGQYHRAVNAFKQAVFPFAAEYLDIFQLPTYFEQNKNMAYAAVDGIKTLSNRLEELNTKVINNNDVVIHNAFFDGTIREPFFTWTNNEVSKQIHRLFSGDKIYLLADVARSSQLNAIKFNRIEVKFCSKNETMNSHLSTVLRSFRISLTHMGESNYRCNNQFYTIESTPHTISYGFGERADESIDHNADYDKLNSGIKLLSPYTLWSIQLFNGKFDYLKPFADFVDIVLQGHGQYVNENAAICNSGLENYYF